MKPSLALPGTPLFVEMRLQSTLLIPAALAACLAITRWQIQHSIETVSPVIATSRDSLRIPESEFRSLAALPLGLPKTGTGQLSGRIALRGKPPAPRPFPPNLGAPVGLSDGSLEVKEANGGLANAIVVLVSPLSDVAIASLPKDPVTHSVEIRSGTSFIPRMMTVRSSDQIIFWNHDSRSFDLLFRTRTLKTPESVQLLPERKVAIQAGPAAQFPDTFQGNPPIWLTGAVMVTSHGLAAITDSDGSFQISGIPVGKHKFTVYHQRLRGMRAKDVIVNGQQASWKGGRFQTTIRDGDNTIGTIEIPSTSITP